MAWLTVQMQILRPGGRSLGLTAPVPETLLGRNYEPPSPTNS